MTILQFKELKKAGKKISVVTCYDYTSARIVADTSIDALLVGDSLAMTMYGHPTTIPAHIDLMAAHTAAVVKGAPKKFVIADMPFLSYRKSLTDNMNAVEKLMYAGAHAIKLEGIVGNEELIAHLVASGVPVMGHLGLTPQSVHQLGGYKVQGRETSAADLIYTSAIQLEKLGAFSVVLECVPSAVTTKVAKSLTVPVVGIGAGPDADGQVLVWQDLLGMNCDFQPKFVRQYMNGAKQIQTALNHFALDVQNQNFPSPKESFE